MRSLGASQPRIYEQFVRNFKAILLDSLLNSGVKLELSFSVENDHMR